VLYEQEQHALRVSVRESAGFQRHYERKKLASGQTHFKLKLFSSTLMESSTNYYLKEPLRWALFHLGDTTRLFRPEMLFAFLEDHLAKATRSERARVDQKLYDQVGRMAFDWSLLSAIRTQRPFTDSLDCGTEASKGMLLKQWREGRDLPEKLAEDEIRELALLLDNFQKLPWPKGKRDAKWLVTAQDVSGRLTSFWDRVGAVK
jgi:hypothetical protein